MTEPLSADTFQALDFFLKGNAQAVSFAVDLLFLSHLIDDLVDRDVERSVEEVKLGFRKLLVDFTHNSFYRTWRHQLEPLMSNAYLTWLDSTYLEQEDREARFSAFYIRNDILRVIHHCMFLVAGPDWIQEQGPAFWKALGVKEAKYHEYVSEVPDDA